MSEAWDILTAKPSEYASQYNCAKKHGAVVVVTVIAIILHAAAAVV